MYCDYKISKIIESKDGYTYTIRYYEGTYEKDIYKRSKCIKTESYLVNLDPTRFVKELNNKLDVLSKKDNYEVIDEQKISTSIR